MKNVQVFWQASTFLRAFIRFLHNNPDRILEKNHDTFFILFASIAKKGLIIIQLLTKKQFRKSFKMINYTVFALILSPDINLAHVKGLINLGDRDFFVCFKEGFILPRIYACR